MAKNDTGAIYHKKPFCFLGKQPLLVMDSIRKGRACVDYLRWAGCVPGVGGLDEHAVAVAEEAIGVVERVSVRPLDLAYSRER